MTISLEEPFQDEAFHLKLLGSNDHKDLRAFKDPQISSLHDQPLVQFPPTSMPAWALALAAVLALCQAGLAQAQGSSSLPLELLKLPPGFRADLYTLEPVPGARHPVLGLAASNATIVYVSSSSVGGGVTALLDRDGDGVAEVVCPILRGLNVPNGIVWHRGALYVIEIPRLVRYDGVDFAVINGCQPSLIRETVLLENLPPQAGHPARALALGPDDKLYFSVAAPFNVGDCGDTYCAIWRVNLNGTGMEVFARGIRNVGGFAWSDDPALEGSMFFTELERDGMGDNAPDDLLQVASESPGKHYQFPYCHWVGGGDPYLRELGPGVPLSDDTMVAPGLAVNGGPSNASQGLWCAENTPRPVQAMGPHVSPLGLTFYPSTPESLPAQEGGPWPVQMFPEEYRGRLFIAQRGSWNRTNPIGYRVMSLEISPGGLATAYSVFAEGWLAESQRVWGRPVGLLVLPDGSLLVAGDHESAVYRIVYEGTDN